MTTDPHTPTDPTSSTPAPAAKPHRRWLPLAGAALVGAVIAAAAMSTTTPDSSADTATATTAPAVTVTADPDPAATVTEPASVPFDLMTAGEQNVCMDAITTDPAAIVGLHGQLLEVAGDALPAADDQATLNRLAERMKRLNKKMDVLYAQHTADVTACLGALTGVDPARIAAAAADGN